MKIPFIDGADVRPGDAASGFAIVNQTFANQYFKGERAVGKSFERVFSAGTRFRYEICGVVADARARAM